MKRLAALLVVLVSVVILHAGSVQDRSMTTPQKDLAQAVERLQEQVQKEQAEIRELRSRLDGVERRLAYVVP